jgi:hypothetical protein
MRTMITSIHDWAVPDEAAAWEILYDAGVDLINTDNLFGLGDFLLAPGSAVKSR